MLENGVWWMIDTDGERRLVDTEEAHMYYYDAALHRWIDLESHPCRIDWYLDTGIGIADPSQRRADPSPQ